MTSDSDSENVFREVTEVEELVAEANELNEQPLPDELDTEALESTRRESERVLERQLDLGNHIEDLAMRNARTAVIVISIIVSAASVGNRSTLSSLPAYVVWTAFAGVLLLTLCVFSGLGAVFATDRKFGIGDSFRDDVRYQDYSRNEWLVTLLEGYDEWTDEMKTELAIGNRFLQRGQFLFFSGVLLLLTAGFLLLLDI